MHMLANAVFHSAYQSVRHRWSLIGFFVSFRLLHYFFIGAFSLGYYVRYARFIDRSVYLDIA